MYEVNVLNQRDILFKTDGYIFSYRVAGILIKNDRVLLQRSSDDTGYSFPGGHVSFGETNAESLIREFKEEMSVGIKVENLQWVAEIFFNWGNRPCHQICLFYRIALLDETRIKLTDTFQGIDSLDRVKANIEFSWIPLSDLMNIELYPVNAREKLLNPSNSIEHFIYRE